MLEDIHVDIFQLNQIYFLMLLAKAAMLPHEVVNKGHM